MIKTWESDMEQCYIPIICEQCGQEVSVRGKVSEDGIRFEPCPNCETPIPVCQLITTDTDKVIDNSQADIVVQVIFFTDGEIQEASFKLGPYQDIISVMQNMTNSACLVFQCPDSNASQIKLEYLHTELQELPKTEQEAIRDYLDSLIGGQ